MLAMIQTMRPAQWIKNIFVFAPLVFSIRFFDGHAWLQAFLAALTFIMVSGAVYIINDILDREKDRKHPIKKHRPIAAGQLSLKSASIFGVLLLAFATIFSSMLSPNCFSVLAAYFAINVIYSKWLKNIAILDVIVIATGFVMRVIVGGYAIGVAVSPWIIIATFMLTLFMGFGKRRHEIRYDHEGNRTSLEFYNKEFLDKLINVSCASAFVSYAVYAVEIAHRLHKISMVYTVAFVAFGLFRYLHFIYFEKEGGEPEKIIFKDRLFVVNMAIWLAVTVYIMGV